MTAMMTGYPTESELRERMKRQLARRGGNGECCTAVAWIFIWLIGMGDN